MLPTQLKVLLALATFFFLQAVAMASSLATVPFAWWSNSTAVSQTSKKVALLPSKSELDRVLSQLINEQSCVTSDGKGLSLVIFSQSNVHAIDLAKFAKTYPVFASVKNALQSSSSTFQISYSTIDPSKYLVKKITTLCENVDLVERPWNDLPSNFLTTFALSRNPTILRLELPPFHTSDDKLGHEIVTTMQQIHNSFNRDGQRGNLVMIYHGTMENIAEVTIHSQSSFDTQSIHQQNTPLVTNSTSPFLSTHVIFTPALFMSVSVALLLVLIASVGLRWLMSVETSYGLVHGGNFMSKKRN